jgi:DNA polymerase III epsilon subunit-like protein
MKPFSDNLIFFDTEFSGLNPYTGEVLSIGMVKMSGEELYLEIEHEGEVSEWVKTKLLPNLIEPKVSRTEAREKILAFAGDTKPHLIAYVMEYDTPFLYKLLGVNDQKGNGNRDLPYHWVVLDFASMLFALGKNPIDFPSQDKAALAKELGIDIKKYRPHHALDDARILRETYLKLIS